MKNKDSHITIETTLGNLIEAVSEAAFENADDASEAYAIAAVVLMDILKKGAHSLAEDDAMPDSIARGKFRWN